MIVSWWDVKEVALTCSSALRCRDLKQILIPQNILGKDRTPRLNCRGSFRYSGILWPCTTLNYRIEVSLSSLCVRIYISSSSTILLVIYGWLESEWERIELGVGQLVFACLLRVKVWSSLQRRASLQTFIKKVYCGEARLVSGRD